MRPYYLITLDELHDAEPASINGENLSITSLGLAFKKFICVGKVMNKMEENERKILKVGNDTYELYFNIGQFFQGDPEKMWDLSIDTKIIISGSISFKEKNGINERTLYAENFRSISEMEYNYYMIHSLKFLNDRVKLVSRIVSAGITDYNEIIAVSGSQFIAEGIYQRIKENKGFDIAKFESLVASASSNEEKTTRENVLDIIKSRGEISLSELINILGERMSREEIEEAIVDLMSSGEITEFRREIYRYVS